MLIVFDWDNTLLSKDWSDHHPIDFNTFDYSNPLKIDNAMFSNHICPLDDKIYAFLQNVLLRHSRYVVILSNSNIEWVLCSAKIYYPKTFDLISRNIQVVSARDMYAQRHNHQQDYDHSTTFWLWKYHAFTHILNLNKHIHHAIAIGDAPFDRSSFLESVRQSAQHIHITKSVKLVENLDYESFVKQFETMTSTFDHVVTHGSSLDLKMTVTCPSSKTHLSIKQYLTQLVGEDVCNIVCFYI